MLSRGNASQDRFANLIIYSSWAGLSLSADNFAKVIFHKPYNTDQLYLRVFVDSSELLAILSQFFRRSKNSK